MAKERCPSVSPPTTATRRKALALVSSRGTSGCGTGLVARSIRIGRRMCSFERRQVPVISCHGSLAGATSDGGLQVLWDLFPACFRPRERKRVRQVAKSRVLWRRWLPVRWAGSSAVKKVGLELINKFKKGRR